MFTNLRAGKKTLKLIVFAIGLFIGLKANPDALQKDLIRLLQEHIALLPHGAHDPVVWLQTAQPKEIIAMKVLFESIIAPLWSSEQLKKYAGIIANESLDENRIFACKQDGELKIVRNALIWMRLPSYIGFLSPMRCYEADALAKYGSVKEARACNVVNKNMFVALQAIENDIVTQITVVEEWGEGPKGTAADKGGLVTEETVKSVLRALHDIHKRIDAFKGTSLPTIQHHFMKVLGEQKFNIVNHHYTFIKDILVNYISSNTRLKEHFRDCLSPTSQQKRLTRGASALDITEEAYFMQYCKALLASLISPTTVDNQKKEDCVITLDDVKDDHAGSPSLPPKKRGHNREGSCPLEYFQSFAPLDLLAPPETASATSAIRPPTSSASSASSSYVLDKSYTPPTKYSPPSTAVSIPVDALRATMQNNLITVSARAVEIQSMPTLTLPAATSDVAIRSTGIRVKGGAICLLFSIAAALSIYFGVTGD